MVEWSAGLLERRTGAGVAEWNRRVRDTGIGNEQELRAWLAERDVTGYAQMVLVMERFGYPDFLLATADELVDGQYADRPGLRPILDRVLAVAADVGEVQVQARKTYVTLATPRRQFALVKPTTKRRVDLGLRLEGQQPGGRLESGKLLGSDVMTVRIPLQTVDDVDDEVVDWLRRGYAANV
ncbi:MAG: hypothetical protein GEV03_29325 [Streptosporangiales bacterium]|nr:hypothetical protein [Streptosporangiales bacterium]